MPVAVHWVWRGHTLARSPEAVTVDHMLQAFLMVGSVLQAVRRHRPVPAVIADLDQAGAAVRDMPAGPYRTALAAVLNELGQCIRTGQPTSARLEAAVGVAIATLAVYEAEHPV